MLLIVEGQCDSCRVGSEYLLFYPTTVVDVQDLGSVKYIVVVWVVPSMALKQTSEIIAIGFSLVESAANTFTEVRVDLQLNPLDNEVFVVSAIDLDPAPPFNVAGTSTSTEMSVSTTSLTAVGNINQSNVLANTKLDIRQDAGSLTGVPFSRTAQDEPQGAVPYIAIISTNDFFVQIQGTANPSVRNGFGRMWGYRAKADSATYAALVQSEVLSS